MAIDPSFGMPYENFQQTGSFVKPVSVPANGPFAGTVYALPCVNNEWLRLLLGCGQQLLNPSTWDPALSDAARVAVLQDATDFLGGLAALDACVNPVVNVAIDCANGLQYQTADGIWHVGTSMADICACTNACLIPVPPPNPGLTPKDQHACNLSGYLASAFLQECVSVAHSALSAGNTVLQYFQQLAADIATGNPFLEVLVTVANDLYPTVQAQPIADVAAVAGDVTLWSEVTCIIFGCIRAVGYLDASNFACVGGGLGAITYPKTWVPPMLEKAWNDAGLSFLQTFESPGSLDDVDCTACPTAWCWYMDFRAGPSGWTAETGAGGWVSSGTYGPGWYQEVASLSRVSLRIHLVLPHDEVVTAVDIWLADLNGQGGNSACDRHVYLENATPAVVSTTPIGNGPFAAITKLSLALTPGATCHQVIIYLDSNDGSSPSGMIQQVAIHGTGVNPFGGDNCPP